MPPSPSSNREYGGGASASSWTSTLKSVRTEFGCPGILPKELSGDEGPSGGAPWAVTLVGRDDTGTPSMWGAVLEKIGGACCSLPSSKGLGEESPRKYAGGSSSARGVPKYEGGYSTSMMLPVVGTVRR
jgi:hypothetical protein